MKPLIFFIILVGAATANAQPGNRLLDHSQMHEIRLRIDLTDWIDTLYLDYKTANEESRTAPERYRKCHWASVDGQEIGPVGLKMKGNFSVLFNAAQQKTKFPFKIAFDEYVDQKYDGLKKINLNTNTNDPSFLREALAYQLLNRANVTAPRTAFARLFVNDTYVGLYSLVENVDKTFLKTHFGSDDDGNLYKGLISGLGWRGASEADYQDAFELKTNESEADWSRLIEWLNLINNTSPDSVFATLENEFELDHFLRLVAIERLINAWDNYSGGGSNYYLYERENGKIMFIPWDYNESFQYVNGVLGVGKSYLIPRNKRPLLDAVFQHKVWRERYFEVVCGMLQSNLFSVDSLLPQVQAWHELIREAYREEPAPLSSFEDFQRSLDDIIGETAAFPKTGFSARLTRYEGLLPYIRHRREWAIQQLEWYQYPCDAPKVHPAPQPLILYPNPIRSGETLHLSTPLPNDATRSLIRVIDATGRAVWVQNWTFMPRNATLEHWPQLAPGLYFIQKLDADGQLWTGKIVKSEE